MSEQILWQNKFGRIRDVAEGPDGFSISARAINTPALQEIRETIASSERIRDKSAESVACESH